MNKLIIRLDFLKLELMKVQENLDSIVHCLEGIEADFYKEKENGWNEGRSLLLTEIADSMQYIKNRLDEEAW